MALPSLYALPGRRALSLLCDDVLNRYRLSSVLRQQPDEQQCDGWRLSNVIDNM